MTPKYVLVPVEPDAEMERAGSSTYAAGVTGYHGVVGEIYSSMLDFRPPLADPCEVIQRYDLHMGGVGKVPYATMVKVDGLGDYVLHSDHLSRESELLAKIEGLTSRYEALKRAAHKLQTVSLRGDVEAIAAYDELTLALSRLEP